MTRPAGRRLPGPGRARVIGNVIVFEAAWFAAVLGAAHRVPLWGTAAIAAAIAWHVAISARPGREAALVACVLAIGFAVETFVARQGHIAYPSGQPDPRFAPYWMVALWGLLAIALNVTLRWLKHRPVLAAVLGGVLGPLSFLGGVRLGGARFIDIGPALATMAMSWALLLPLLMMLSNRLDGVVPDAPIESPDA